MKLQIIGAGYGRTGTFSLKHALEKLLDAPCYHMYEITQSEAQLCHWLDWAKHPESSPDWDAILDGYAAAVDAPVCFFWEELMQRYPDAKVILTTRDPDSWVRSFKALMATNIKSSWMGLFSSKIRRFGKFGRAMGGQFLTSLERGTLIEQFERHNQRVRDVVPPDRLLELQIGAGWEPLCEFLGVPVPDEPYPYLNKGMETIKRGHREMAFGKRKSAAGAGA